MNKLFSIVISLFLIMAPVSGARASEATGGIAKQILGISNGIVGSSVLVKCTLGSTQLSLPVYMAGGVVYVMSELTGAKKKKQDISTNAQSMIDLKSSMTEGGDYQKAAVEMQIADEKSNLEFVQKRRKWMMAIKVIFTVATSLAVLEQFLAAPPIFKRELGGCAPMPGVDGPTLALFSTAYGALASSGSMKGMVTGVAVSAAASFFPIALTVATTLQDKTMGMLNMASGRIAFFGANTALAVIIDNELKKEEERIKSNLAQLEKVKAQFDKADNSIAEGTTQDAGGSTSGAGAGLTDPSKGQYALKGLPAGTKIEKNCFSQTSKGAVAVGESACTNPLKFTKTNLDPRLSIPALQVGANTSMDLADAIASGNVGKADLEASKLAAMAGNLDKIKDELIKKANDKLIAEGKKPIDIDGELKRQATALSNALNKASPGSGNSLADLSSSENAKLSETTKTEVETTNDKVTTVTATNAPGVIDLSNITAGSMDGLGSIPSDEIKDDKLASLEDSLSQYEDNQTDIAKNPDVSIFKQVSNRYFLNYNKIFNRKEITPPLAEPTK